MIDLGRSSFDRGGVVLRSIVIVTVNARYVNAGHINIAGLGNINRGKITVATSTQIL